MAPPVGRQQGADGLIFKCWWRFMNGGGEKNQDRFHYYNLLQKIHSVSDMFLIVFPDFCWQAKVVSSHPALEWSDKCVGKLTQGTVFWVINSFHWYRYLNLAFFSKPPSGCLQNNSVPDKCHPHCETFKDMDFKKMKMCKQFSIFFKDIFTFILCAWLFIHMYAENWTWAFWKSSKHA